MTRFSSRYRVRFPAGSGNRSTRRRCIALIWTVVSFLVLFAMVGLALDTGLVVLARQQLQVAADAAALAGAVQVQDGVALGRTAAVNIALQNTVLHAPVQLDRNDANAADGEIVVGRYDRTARTFTPQLTAVNAIKVRARRTTAFHGGVPLVFGPVFGVGTVDVTCEAIAMFGGGTGGGVIALDPIAPCSFSVGGTGTLDLIDYSISPPGPGAIQVNSNNGCAACTNGGPTIVAGQLNTPGGACLSSNTAYAGDVNSGARRMSDPLAGVPPPPYNPASPQATNTVVVQNGNNVTLSPGYYKGGISMTGGNLTLQPGIYVLDGEGLDVNGGNFYAHGVMLYIIDSTPGKKPVGDVNLAGNGTIDITEPDPKLYNYPGVDTYEGIAIFQARDNTNPATIRGTNNLNIQGSLYFPANLVDVGGTGGNVGTQLIANTIAVQGTGIIHIDYDGRFKAPGRHAFLVE